MLKKSHGFTMIELMIVLSVAAVLALIAAPSFGTFLNNTRLSSAAMQLVSDLNLARSEAIKRNSRVLICARNTAGTDCANETNWQPGWVVCTDGDNDNVCDTSTAANPNPLTVRAAQASGLTLSGTAAIVRFNPNGSQGSGTAATLTLGGSWSGATARIVSVAATGNVSSQ